ncbi:hypothetical protein K1X76_08420 [bacterium]|nr:hypothetical protein [bacterium]
MSDVIIPGNTTNEELYQIYNEVFGGDLSAMEAAFTAGDAPEGYDLVDLFNAIVHFSGSLPDAVVAYDSTFPEDISEEDAEQIAVAMQYWMTQNPNMEAMGTEFLNWLGTEFSFDPASLESQVEDFINSYKDSGGTLGPYPSPEEGETVFSLLDVDDLTDLIHYALTAYSSPAAVMNLLILGFQTRVRDMTDAVVGAFDDVSRELEDITANFPDDPLADGYQYDVFQAQTKVENLRNAMQTLTNIVKTIQDMMQNMIQTQAATNESSQNTLERLNSYIAS